MPLDPSDWSLETLANKIYLQGIILTGVFYGLVVMLCCSCLYHLSSNKRNPFGPSTRGHRRWLRIYVLFLLLLSTIVITVVGKQAEIEYLEKSDYPGGPAAFALTNRSALVVVEVFCFVFLQWAADGLLMWRCFSFFPPTSPPQCFIFDSRLIVSILAFLNVGFSSLFLISSLSPMSLGPPRVVYYLILTYGFYTFFLNASITLAILVTLFRQRQRLQGLFGKNQANDSYLSIMSILVESAAVIIVYDLFFLVSAVLNHPLALIGRRIGIMVQIIPPLMIIQRVGRGTAWSSNRSQDEWVLSSISCPAFGTPPNTTDGTGDCPTSQNVAEEERDDTSGRFVLEL